MSVLAGDALRKIRSGELTLGLGIHHLRGAAVPLLAKAAGYDWLFLDAEHGTISAEEVAQIALAGLANGIAPIVRICSGALDEGTRALDNGALGIVVPHVDTVEQARSLIDAFRFAPLGHRSTGGPPAQFAYRPPAAAEAQRILNAEILIVPMIETPRAVESAEQIAALEGVDALLIGTNDLCLEMGIPGQVGHERVRAAYERVAEACRRHKKILGMGGVYDQEVASRYVAMGARMVLAGSDHNLLLEAATRRAAFLRDIPRPQGG
jgi:2-keto-3-deoxy-L-rhamnonate aldolase RhmA